MSDNRKILIAKRKPERSKYTNTTETNSQSKQEDNLKKAVKRPLPCTPAKNLANDRLKRLRTCLTAEATKTSVNGITTKGDNFCVHKTAVSLPRNISNVRKRHVDTSDVSVTKVSKSNADRVDALSKSSDIKEKVENFISPLLRLSNNKESNNSNKSTATNYTHLAALSGIRISSNIENDRMEWSLTDEDNQSKLIPSQSNTSHKKINQPSDHSTEDDVFVVVDTNILMGQVEIVRDIMEMTLPGTKKAIIYIPWIVIEELDFIKDNPSKSHTQRKAQEAVKFIEQTIGTKNNRIIGQTLNDVNEQKDTGKSQDNKIIGCCLQLIERHQTMILVTNDINLRNKAHINHVPVCSQKEIMSRLSVLLSNSTKSEIIMEKMTKLCTEVIKECARKAYGEVSSKMPICQSTPQSFQDCSKIFTKYWFPVFQEILMKQFKKSIDDLSTFLINNIGIKDDSDKLNELLKLCIRVCIFLKDVDSCKSTIESTIIQLNGMKQP